MREANPAAGFSVARRDLDIDRRAWIVADGRMHDIGIGATACVGLGDLLDAACATGEYPYGAFQYEQYEPRAERLVALPGYRTVTARIDDNGAPYLEGRVVLGEDGVVGTTFTRSGRLGDSGVYPGDVLLTDVEATLSDVFLLSALLVKMTDYRGVTSLRVDIAAEVADSPLRLRSFDEQSGDLSPVGGGTPARFTPVTLEVGPGVSRRDSQLLLWQAATRIAAQFGVSLPQLLRDPAGVPRGSLFRTAS